jgi:hypothetical protein
MTLRWRAGPYKALPAEARTKLLDELGTDDISSEDVSAIRAEIRGSRAPRQRACIEQQEAPCMTGVTLDTGAWVAMERADKRMRTLLVAASADPLLITVPAVVIAEWWRGRSRRRLRILGTVDVEPTSEVIARSADLMVLVDKYPIATADTRTWLSLTLLVLWAMLVLLCGLLAEASARGL